MVLYSIIKPYNLFFCDKSSYCTARFHMNYQLSGVRNPGKILKFTYQTVFYVRCNDITHTASGTEVLQTQAECIYKFVRIE